MSTRQENLSSLLKKTEVRLGSTAKDITQTRKAMTHEKRELTKTNRQLTQYQQNLTTQHQLLDKQIRAAYMLGHDPYIKILLNQENPEKINRQLQYYQYVCQARIDIIHQINITTTKIVNTSNKIQKHQKDLKEIQLAEKKQQLLQKHEKVKRQHLLNTINVKIKGTHKQLEQLYANKKHFEYIIRELSQHEQYGYAPGSTFSHMHKKLYWPTASKHITQHFNAPLARGRLRSTGILIREKTGEQVHSIFPGKVVFANWLKGFGLLVIVQHGKSYLTLYGRNESLYVKAGENINAGDVIATAGNSGGYTNTALYFEVRYKGKPENPLRWLKS